MAPFETKTTKKKIPPWEKSGARAVMMQDLKDGVIMLDPRAQPPRHVHAFYKDHPAFQGGWLDDKKAFARRLLSLRKIVQLKVDKAEVDAAALAHDRRIYPEPTLDSKGLPHWKNSEAKRLMNIDINNNKHTRFTPAAFQLSRAEYMVFPKDTFRNHIYKELLKRKEFVKTNKSGKPLALASNDDDGNE